MSRRKNKGKKKNKAPAQMQAPSIAMVSLGCAKNLVDTENLMGDFYDNQFRLTAAPEDADIVLVNTCGFIQASVDESNESIKEMVELKESYGVNQVVAMGCYASRAKDDILAAHPGLDGVYTLNETKQMVDDLVDQYRSHSNIGSPLLAGIRPISVTMPHYSYLKISEGCNRTCTYCTIPDIRGPNVDKTIEQLVEESKRLADRGVRELNLIAQDTTAYGIDAYGEPRLLELLQELVKVDGLEWIRLLYAYPDYLSDELADFLIEAPKMVNYLELPIQHASPSVLRRMNRADSFEIYDRLFDRLRSKNPEYALRTTVIVGFPGETEGEFNEMLEYIDKRHFDRLGSFKYFQEKGTPADRMKDQVSEELKLERHEELMLRQQKRHLADNEKWVGKDMSFIVDEVNEDGSHAYGRTWRDAVEIDAGIYVESSTIPLQTGMIASCRITGLRDYDLEGVL